MIDASKHPVCSSCITQQQSVCHTLLRQHALHVGMPDPAAAAAVTAAGAGCVHWLPIPICFTTFSSAAVRCALLQLQVWKATVYLTPLLGGYLADAGGKECCISLQKPLLLYSVITLYLPPVTYLQGGGLPG
jgi:hypothetical protein